MVLTKITQIRSNGLHPIDSVSCQGSSLFNWVSPKCILLTRINKIIFLLLLLFICHGSFYTLNAQVVLLEDYESYTVDEGLFGSGGWYNAGNSICEPMVIDGGSNFGNILRCVDCSGIQQAKLDYDFPFTDQEYSYIEFKSKLITPSDGRSVLRLNGFQFGLHYYGTHLSANGSNLYNVDTVEPDTWYDVRLEIDWSYQNTSGGYGRVTHKHKKVDSNTWLTNPTLTNFELNLSEVNQNQIVTEMSTQIFGSTGSSEIDEIIYYTPPVIEGEIMIEDFERYDVGTALGGNGDWINSDTCESFIEGTGAPYGNVLTSKNCDNSLIDTLIYDFPFDTDQFSYIQCNMRMDLEHFRSSIDLITEDGMISFGMDGKVIYLLANGAYYSSASFNGDISYTNWHDIKLEIDWTHQADDGTYGLATLKYKETTSDTFIVKHALENIALHVADPTQINMIRIRNRALNTDDYAASVDNISYYSETIEPSNECPTGDINLTEQAHVDTFVASYPDCDTIFGNLTIGTGITNLAGLSSITHITGTLRTNTNQLTSLEGLNQLESIGGNLDIKNTTVGNDQLINLDPLSNLSQVGGDVQISANNNLISIQGIRNISTIGGKLHIDSNPSLTNLSGIEDIQAIGGELIIQNNSSLTDCRSICKFIDGTDVGGPITISSNPSECSSVNEVSLLCENTTCSSGNITFANQPEVNAFVQDFPNCDTIFGNLTIGAGVTDLTGLSAITYIQGNFRTNTYQLTSLEGLNQLTAIGGNLEINNASYGGDLLNDISALSAVVSVGGNIIIRNNQNITTLDGLQNILSIGGSLEIVSNPNLNICDAICPIVNGAIPVTGITASNNAPGCSSIQQLSFSCNPNECPDGSITFDNQTELNVYIDNFPTCDTIFGNLTIGAGVTDLTGLSAITYIQGNFRTNTYQLTSLQGLNQLTVIGGNLEINNASYGGDLLNDISALSAVVSVGGNIIIRNNQNITTLDGLQNILSIGGGLEIVSNPNLNICDAICPIVNGAIPVTGITASNNASGCASIQQINFSCDQDECPNGSVTFSNQAEVDLYLSSFSTCDTIFGNLIIQGSVNDISGLSNLVYIQGNLRLINNTSFNSLQGLSGLTAIGGNLQIINADALTSLQGLENLTAIGGLMEIISNNSLSDCSSICQLINNATIGGTTSINGNPSTCSSLNEVTLLCGNTTCPTGNITLSNQIDVNAFVQAYPNCDTIFGNLTIQGSVSDISGLNNIAFIQGNLRIINNSSLTSIQGLNGLNAIAGNLQIINFHSITSLQGLENLSSVGGYVEIINNNSLSDCSSICQLINNATVGGTTSINGNPSTCSSLNEVTLLCGNTTCPTGNITLSNQIDVNAFVQAYPTCDTIFGSLTIQGSVNDISGLINIIYVEGSLIIQNTSSLNEIEGLTNINAIGGNLGVTNNQSLIDCALFCDLINNDAIGGSITINGNPSECTFNEVIAICNIVSNDLKVESFAGPSAPFIPGNNIVKVVLYNAGSDTLFQADISWLVNNIAQPSILWTGNLLPEERDTVDLGSYLFETPLPYNIQIESSNPNGLPDNNTLNDYLNVDNIYAALSGEFTIGGINPDFVTFTDAVLALRYGGVYGPVTMNVRDGNYEDRISFNEILGSSLANNITFQSENLDRNKVTLYYNVPNVLGVINLNRTGFITFKALTFSASNTQERIAQLINGVNNVNFIENHFRFNQNNSIGTHIYFENQNNNNQFSENIFDFGKIGIEDLINQGEASVDNQFIGNQFFNQTAYSIASKKQNDLLIHQNEFDTYVENNYTAIRILDATNNLRISENKIRNASQFGLTLHDCTGSINSPIVVANNFIHVKGSFDGAGITTSFGTHHQYYFNSINNTSSNAASTAFKNTSTQNITSQNNIFNHSNDGYAIISNTSTEFTTSNYNNFYSSGNHIANINGNNLSTLLDWQTTSGKDANSLSVLPLFFSDTDLHNVQVDLNEAGTPIPAFLTDIDLEVRNTLNPDIGADEFSPISNDLGVTDLLFPSSSCEMSSTEKVEIQIQNFSGSDISNFSVGYILNQTDTIIESTDGLIVPAGTTASYEFQNTIDLTTIADYTFETFTLLNGDSRTYNDTLITIVRSIPELIFAGDFSPEDGALDVNTETLLSWIPVSGATFYDIYLWKEGENIPTNPTAGDLVGISYSIQNLPNQAYNWQVVAKTDYCEVSSSEMSFLTQGRPNLIVDSITVPSGDVFSGQVLDLSWIIKNIGAGDTENRNWVDRISLSADTIYHGSNIDPYLKAVGNFSALDPDSIYLSSTSVTLPQNITGEYYIFINTDNNSNISEEEEQDNIKFSEKFTVLLTPPADLQVTLIQNPNNTISGQTLDVTYTVSNEREGETPNNNWKDRMYISEDDLLDGGDVLLKNINHTGILQGDSAYTEIVSVDIPISISGTYYIIVQTDYNNDVYEFANEANNIGVGNPINIVLAQLPDLIITDFIAPAVADNTEVISVYWQVSNNGISAGWPSWIDNIYISPTLSDTIPEDVILLDNTYREDSLQISETYTSLLEVPIPDTISGPHYLYLSVDGNSALFESIGEANNTARLPIEVRSPDLTIPSIELSNYTPNSSDTIQLDYQLRNDGLGTLRSGSWRDVVYLSPTLVFDSSAIELTSIEYMGNTINAQNELSKSASVRIPNGLQGNYYIFMVTDYEETIFEGDQEDNNIANSSLLSIQLSDWPNLRPINSATIPSAQAGEYVPVNFEITNAGVASIPADRTWSDVIYISSSPIWNPNIATPINTTNLSQALAVSENYNVIKNVQIPVGLASGNYFLHYFADQGNAIYEHTDESDNVYTSSAFFVTGHPPVDLVADTVAGPLTINSSVTAAFNWTITNQAVVPTISNFWSDAIYLSTDTTWQRDQDIFVAERVKNGNIAASASYNVTLNAAIPNGTQGDYYIMVVSDYTQRNNDSYRPNNYQVMVDNQGVPVTTTIGLTPPPDLSINAFEAPSEGPAGQPITVNYSVANTGQADIPMTTWSDRFFLSDDTEFSAGDYPIVTNTQNRSLAINDVYEESVEMVLPNNLEGNWYLLFKTDYTDNIYEYTNEDNNTVAWTLTIGQPLASDLTVTNISVQPLQALPGEPIDISWSVKNLDENIAEGTMKEAVFISEDPVWDIGDPLLGTVTSDVYIPFNDTHASSLTANLVGVADGEYYILIRTDIQNNIFESNTANNMGISGDKIQVAIPELFLDIPKYDSIYNFSPSYYKLEIPGSLEEESLLLSLNGDALIGANELYMRYEAIPTRTTYDYNHSIPYQGTQEIIVPELQAGTYYVMAYGSTLEGVNQADTLLARILDFEIIEIDKNSGGNTGKVTVKLRGSKFDPQMQVWLRAPNGDLVAGQLSLFIDQTQAFYTFNLFGQETGHYDVLATNSAGNDLVITDGFEVIEGTPRDLAFNVTSPESIAFRSIHVTTLEYTNNGNTDILNPILDIETIIGIPIALSISELNDEQIFLSVPLSEINGPENILRPGASGIITIYAKALAHVQILIRQRTDVEP